MIELKISDGEYLTHEDLEKYLNEYEEFYRKTFEDGVLEFEWKELIRKHNEIIVNTINSFDKIELIVKDIRIENQYEPKGLGGHLNESSIKLRGEEIGEWKYLERSEKEVYKISFDDILINNPILPPYKFKGTSNGFSVPKIKFHKITTSKPSDIKKGSRYIFEINIISSTRYLGTEEFIFVDYIEKVNLIPNKKETSNSNCFVVTTTMGDTNHPVVVDFRNYRDEVLLNTILGRLFIKVYYQIGPTLSGIIKNNNTLFQISRSLILKLHKRIFKK